MPGRASVFHAANLAMVVLFIVAAGLQYNDPDPEAWMPLYFGAAVACVLAWRRPGTWGVAALVGVVALAWAAWLAPGVIPQFAMGHLFTSMKAGTLAIELSREFLGLLIVAAWMAIVAVFSLVTRH
jgi:hypothetical protein